MGKFREKLLDWKKRLSDRHMYSVIIIMLAVVAAWGIYQYKRAADLRQELDNQYNRAFYEMVGYVQNVEILLMKGLVSSTTEMSAETLQEAWHQANLAQTNLGQLPITQDVLANTSKFLSQVGDFSYALDRQNINGKEIDDKQYKTLKDLHQYSVTLQDGLNNLQSSISGGRLRWNELAQKGTPLFQKQSQNMTSQLFTDIDNTFQEFPTLIYDGPFSDHMTSQKPKGLTGNDMSMEQARDKLIKFIGEDRVASIEHAGDIQTDTLPAYNFKIKFKDRPEDEFATADVTKKGGHVIWMLYARDIGQETLNVDKAKEAGLKFLESRGYKNMKETYYIKEDSMATINYAYSQDDVVIYPDLIKVKIALDTGEVVGFESKGFIMNHTEREIPAPTLTEEQAKAKMSRSEVKAVGLAVIPTTFGTELFCYELKGKLDDRDFIVYINAKTGKEEQVIIIINTPNGILTM